MTRKKFKTYEATVGGRKTRVTVPENDEQDLFDAIREELSPEAVATIARALQKTRVKHTEVERQVRWFADELVKLVGGYDAYTRLAAELGL